MDIESMTEAARADLFWRMLLGPLARLMVAEMAGRGLLVAGPGSPGEIERLTRENASLRKLAEGLHEQLRRAQDDLAALEVKALVVSEWSAGDEAKAADLEDSVADEALPSLPQKPAGPASGKCETCLWWSTKICQRVGCPQLNRHVGAANPCGPPWYKFTNLPRRQCVAKVGEPKGAVAGGKAESGHFAKGVCPACGHTVCGKRDGAPFAHDRQGRLYRGTSGADKSQPCSGKKGK